MAVSRGARMRAASWGIVKGLGTKSTAPPRKRVDRDVEARQSVITIAAAVGWRSRSVGTG